MDTNQQFNSDDEHIRQVIREYFRTGSFKDRKLTDTPTDDLQVVNKKYVDGLATSIYGRMYLAGAQNVNNATNSKILLDTTNFVAGITADTTNHRFTALTDGYYFAFGAVLYQAPTDAGYMTAMIYVNGSETANCAYVAKTTGSQGIEVSNLVHLAIGDYVELYTRNDNGSAKDISTGSAFTYFNIFKV